MLWVQKVEIFQIDYHSPEKVVEFISFFECFGFSFSFGYLTLDLFEMVQVHGVLVFWP